MNDPKVFSIATAARGGKSEFWSDASRRLTFVRFGDFWRRDREAGAGFFHFNRNRVNSLNPNTYLTRDLLQTLNVCERPSLRYVKRGPPMYVGPARFYCLYRTQDTLWIDVAIGFLVLKGGATTSTSCAQQSPPSPPSSRASIHLLFLVGLLGFADGEQTLPASSAAPAPVFCSTTAAGSAHVRCKRSPPPPLCPPVSAVILRGKRERRRLIDAVTRLMVK